MVTLIELIVIDTTLPVKEIFSLSNPKIVEPDTYGKEGELRFMEESSMTTGRWFKQQKFDDS